MTDLVHIADFNEQDRDQLLEYLWESTDQYIEADESFDIERAKMQINENEGYAHIICGRKIEMYIYNVEALEIYMYDFHNGVGSVQEIVMQIREKKKMESEKNINALFDNFKMSINPY